MKYSEQLKKLYKENRGALQVGAVFVALAVGVLIIVATNV